MTTSANHFNGKIKNALFPSRTTLEELTQQAPLPWYKSYNTWAIILFVLSLATGLISNFFINPELKIKYSMLVQMVAILFPIIYLFLKNWRSFILFMLLYFIADKIFTIWVFYQLQLTNWLDLSLAIIWGTLVADLMINSYRYASVLAHFPSTDKPNRKKEALTALISCLTLLLLAYTLMWFEK